MVSGDTISVFLPTEMSTDDHFLHNRYLAIECEIASMNFKMPPDATEDTGD